MAFSLSSRAAGRLRTAGLAIALAVLATAPLERWYLTRRSNAMHARIVAAREAAAARQPGGWQADTTAARAVADLEYRRAQVRHRLLAQWTLEGWTVRLLIVGGLLAVTGFVVRPRAAGGRAPG